MKRFKITFTKALFFVVVMFFAVAGVKSIFFPPRPANIITDDEKNLLEELGIKTNGNDGGDVSPAFGFIDFGESSTGSGSDITVSPSATTPAPPVTITTPQVYKDNGAEIYANDATPFSEQTAPALTPVNVAPVQAKPADEPSPFAPVPIADPVPVKETDNTPVAPIPTPSVESVSPFALPADKPLTESSSDTSSFSNGNSTPLVLPISQIAVIKPLPRIVDERVAMNLSQRVVLPVPVVDAPSPPTAVAPPPIRDNTTSTTASINPIRPSDTGFSPFLADINKVPAATNSPVTAPTTVVPDQPYHRTSIRTDSVAPNTPIVAFAQPVSSESVQERFKSYNSNQTLNIEQNPLAVALNSSHVPKTTPPPISFSSTPPASSLISFDNDRTNVNANIVNINTNTNTNNTVAVNQLRQPASATSPNMSQPNAVRPRVQSAPAAVPKLRDSVIQYVKAQCVLIDSGSAKAIREGYSQLSQLLRHSELNDEERQYLMPMLNQLAHDVIFTPNIHVLELPYRVGQSDTIESIANQFDLPPSVLMRINGLTNSQTLIPGSEIKVVYGPFDVYVNRKRGEIWLILNGLYAGCYKLFNDHTINLSGNFSVVEKRLLGANNDIPWIDLGNGIGLISTKEMRNNLGGSIILVPDKEMPELYELITVKSGVTIE